MTVSSKIIMITVLAGAMALAAIGVVQAQTADNAVIAADTQELAVPTAATTVEDTADTSALPCAGKGRRQHLEEMAEELGITSDELRTEIDSGKPFYQIAAEHGLTYEKQQANRLSEIKTRLDDMVKVGYMTQDQADQAYENAQAQPMLGGLGMGFGRGRGMHGF